MSYSSVPSYSSPSFLSISMSTMSASFMSFSPSLLYMCSNLSQSSYFIAYVFAMVPFFRLSILGLFVFIPPGSSISSSPMFWNIVLKKSLWPMPNFGSTLVTRGSFLPLMYAGPSFYGFLWTSSPASFFFSMSSAMILFLRASPYLPVSSPSFILG